MGKEERRRLVDGDEIEMDERGEEEEEEEWEEDEEDEAMSPTGSLDGLTKVTVSRVVNHERTKKCMFAGLFITAVCFLFVSPWRLLNDAHGVAGHAAAQDRAVGLLEKVADANRSLIEANSLFLQYTWTQQQADLTLWETMTQQAMNDAVMLLVNETGDTEIEVRIAQLGRTINSTVVEWNNNVSAHLREVSDAQQEERAQDEMLKQYRLQGTVAKYNTILQSMMAEIERLREVHGDWLFQNDPITPAVISICHGLATGVIYESDVMAFGQEAGSVALAKAKSAALQGFAALHTVLQQAEAAGNSSSSLTAAQIITWRDQVVADQQVLATMFSQRITRRKFAPSFATILEGVIKDANLILGGGEKSDLHEAIAAIEEMYNLQMAVLRELRDSDALSPDIDDVVRQSVLWPFVCAATFTLLALQLFGPWRPLVGTELKVSGLAYATILIVSLGIFTGMCGLVGRAAQSAIDEEEDHAFVVERSRNITAVLGRAAAKWRLSSTHLDEALMSESQEMQETFWASLRETEQVFQGISSEVDSVLDVSGVVSNVTSLLLPELFTYGTRLLDQRRRVDDSLPHFGQLMEELDRLSPLRESANSRATQVVLRLQDFGKLKNRTDDACKNVEVEAEILRVWHHMLTGHAISFIMDSVSGRDHPSMLRFQSERAQYDKQVDVLDQKLRLWTTDPPVPKKLVGELATEVSGVADALTHMSSEAHRLWDELEKLMEIKKQRNREDIITVEKLRGYRGMLDGDLRRLNSQMDRLVLGWQRTEQDRMANATATVRSTAKHKRYSVVWTAIVGLWGLSAYWRLAFHLFFDGFTAAARPVEQLES